MKCCKCRVQLPTGRLLTKCGPCHNLYIRLWRRKHLGPTKMFPGVDIDAIHFNNWKKKNRGLSKGECVPKYGWRTPLMAESTSLEEMERSREVEKVES